jgi:hypothetical protein
MRFAALVLSVLLHPLWMPTLVLSVAFAFDPHIAIPYPIGFRWFLVGMVFAMTGLFPLISALLMRRTGAISGLSMPQRTERLMPYAISLMYYGMCYWLLRRNPAHPMLLSLFFGATIAMALTLLITFRWKISAHMVGIGGLVGAFASMISQHDVTAWPLIGILWVVAGALGTARLLTSDHTPAQIYGGAVVGGLCVFVCAETGVWV